jgi:hypothetical protein
MSLVLDTADPAARPAVDRRTPRDVTLARALHAEWVKFAGLRSSWATIGLTLLISLGLGALISDGRGRMFAGLPAPDRAAFDPTNVSILGADVLGQLPLAALAILMITSEYATGTIRGTFTAAPGRGTVFAAKALLVAGVCFVVGEVASFGSYLIGQSLLATHDGVPHTTLAEPQVLRAVAGSGVILTLCALLGLALGALTRATAGALTLLTTFTLLIPLMAGLLPEWLATWWPPTAGSQIAHVVPVAGAAEPWPGLAVLVGSVAAVLVAAVVTLRRRDA